MRWISSIACLLFCLAANPVSAKTPVDLVLALAVDVSRSVDNEEAHLQRQGYIQAFRDPEVVAAIQTGMRISRSKKAPAISTTTAMMLGIE